MPTAWRPTRPRPKASIWVGIGLGFLLAGPAGASTSGTAAPEPHALLIGVARYANLPPALRLEAPGNDVRRMSDALTSAGYPEDHIEIMTEDGPRVPTRSAVLQALADLAREAAPGQEILIYFSGHGAQTTARYADREPDGLQEIYLMADADEAGPLSPEPAGTIADFELEAAIERIRAAGADVVLIADTCHAAGVTRSAVRDGRVKGLTADDLGLSVRPSALRSASRDPVPLRGDFTGIFAAGPGDLAVERRLPLGQPNAAPASVFTYALAQTIRDGRYRSWRDLQEGTREAGFEAGPGPVPVFEGNLDRVPAGLDPDRPRWFRTYASDGQTVVAAGALEGILPGDVLELADLSGELLGRAVVTGGDALTARFAGMRDGSMRARRLQQGAGEAFLQSIAPYVLTEASGGPLDIASQVKEGDCDAPISADGTSPGLQPINMTERPRLSHCDVLFLSLRNSDGTAVDVAVLFVNARGQVTPLTLAPDDSPRIGPGQTRHAALRVLTQDAAGQPLATGYETIVVAWTPARGRTPRDLRALSHTQPTRGTAQSGFSALTYTILTVPVTAGEIVP